MVKHALSIARTVPQLSAAALLSAVAVVGLAGIGATAYMAHVAVRASVPSCTIGSPRSTANIEFRGQGAVAACSSLARQEGDMVTKRPTGEVVCDFSRKGVEIVVRDDAWAETDGLFTCWALGAPDKSTRR